MNDYRRTGYGGPCPSPGKPHRYFIRIWGLEEKIDLQPGAEREELEGALAAATEYGETMATYGRKAAPEKAPGAGHRT